MQVKGDCICFGCCVWSGLHTENRHSSPIQTSKFPWRVSWRVHLLVYMTTKFRLTSFICSCARLIDKFSLTNFPYVLYAHLLVRFPWQPFTRASFLAEKLTLNKFPSQGKTCQFTHRKIKLDKEICSSVRGLRLLNICVQYMIYNYT